MGTTLCGVNSCKREVINRSLTAFVSFLASAMALAQPFANSVAGNVKATSLITGYNISSTSLIILGTWLLSGIIGSSERHTNVFLCAMSALGLPAMLLAALSIGKL